MSLALTEALALSDDEADCNDDSVCEVDEADVNPSAALPLAAPLAADSSAERNASVSYANWLHALSEVADDDALVEVEAVDVADAVDVEEVELNDCRSLRIAFKSACSSESKVLALEEESLEVDEVEEVDDTLADAPGGGPPGGGPLGGVAPTADEAELAAELGPSWEIRAESSDDTCTGLEKSVADEELLAEDADVEVDCDEALF